jgi:hypothetical protein
MGRPSLATAIHAMAAAPASGGATQVSQEPVNPLDMVIAAFVDAAMHEATPNEATDHPTSTRCFMTRTSQAQAIQIRRRV